MEVRKANINKFISTGDMVFVIPVYQRNYDWDKDNCHQLYLDVKSLIGTNMTHFMGTICYKMEGRYKSVIIDGQQRITSIMLFLKALYDLCDDDVLRSKIKNQFLINPYANNDLKLKLKPVKKDEAIYSKLINLDEFSEQFFSKDEINSNIFRNYSYYKDWIISDIADGISIKDLEDAIEALEVAEIELTDENPQIIFESLNSTGMNLTNTDLLRNYLLMSMDYTDQEELYNKYWLQIENILESSNMEMFLIHYLVLKRRSNAIMEKGKKAVISSKNVYHAFKITFPNIQQSNAKKEISNIFKDLYRYANIYKHFLYNQETKPTLLNKVDKKLYELFYLLEEKQAAVVVLYLYELFEQGKVSEEIFIELLDICISFAFRSKVCNHQGFNNQFCGNTIAKLDPQPVDEDFIDRFWAAIVSGRGRFSFPRDLEFKEALVNHEIYTSLKSAGTKYLLYSLEINREHSKELPPYESGTIEHVMPQTLSKEWADYLNKRNELKNYELYLHTLGNLALTNYNSTLSNSLFRDKCGEYIKSNYAYTRDLPMYKEWTSVEINTRGLTMAQDALNIWKLPQNFNKNLPIENGVTYNLQADFPSFLGTKPAIVSVCDEEETITTWADLVVKTAKKLRSLDSDIFDQTVERISKRRIKPLFYREDNGPRRSAKLDDDLYINLDYHTDENLQNVKDLVETFDGIAGTNFIDDIWFTIRRKN